MTNEEALAKAEFDPAEFDITHAGMGSDLMALCGKMLGISGHDQVRLSYVDDQVTCVDCLRLRIKQIRKKLATGV